MTDKQIIHGEQEPLITLTRQQLEEDWFTLWELYKAKEQECERTKERLESFQKDYSKLYQVVENKGYIKELDQLKEQLEAYKMEAKEGKEINAELKAMQKDLSFENQKFCYQIEELTKQLKPFKDEYFKGLDNVTIAELAKKSIRITAENCKLEQTLTEIKEIANFDCQCGHNQMCICNVCDKFEQILQKISEVENDNA